jgi:hypothetical protein
MHENNQNRGYTKTPEHLNGNNKAASHPEPPPEEPTKEANEDFGNNLPDHTQQQDQADNAEPQEGERFFKDLTQIDISLPEWLWHNRLQRSAVNLLAGDPESGKSFLAAALGSILSRGGTYPDGQKAQQPETVLIFDGEQGGGKFKARAMPNSPELSNFKIFDPQISFPDEHGNTIKEPPDITKHPEIIKEQIRLSGASLVIIDPLNHFISNVDTKSDAQMRNGVYSPLFQVAQETGAAILPVAHLNKDQTMSAKKRINGSIANLGAPRSIFIAGEDPDDEESGRIIFSQVKNNDAPKQDSLAYTLESVYLYDENGDLVKHKDNTPGHDDGTPGEVGKVVFQDVPPDIDVQTALSGDESLIDRKNISVKARNLKRKGYSVRQIAEQLELRKSTASNYAKGAKQGEELEAEEDNDQNNDNGRQYNQDTPF